MKLEELKNILESTGLPVAYDQFPESDAPDLPYIVYRETGTDNFGADNKVWAVMLEVKVDLLVARRDMETEGLIEKVFDENDIFWNRIPSNEGNEHYSRIIYEIEV